MAEWQPSADEARAAARVIESVSGVVVPEYRWPVLGAELHRLGGAGGAAAALDRLEAGDPAVREVLVDTLTIPETYLFRHPAHFHLLHRFAAERAHNGRGTRVLSAGCSTGEEAWSAAAVLASVPLPPGSRHRVDGWDLCAERVAWARRGSYGPWSLRGGLLEYGGFFQRDGSMIQPDPSLRQLVEFAQVNLVAGPVGDRQPYDVVFLRNVAIYWKPSTVGAVWRRLAGLLAADGLFLVGPSDPVELPREIWRQQVDEGARVVRRQGSIEADRSRVPLAPATGSSDGERPPAGQRATTNQRPTTPHDRRQEPAQRPTSGRPRSDVPPGADIDGTGSMEEIRLLADAGRYHEALDLLRDGDAAGTVEARSWCGILNLALEDATEAVRLFRQCVFLEPSELSHRRWLAAAYESAGMAEAAAREMRNAEELAAT
jgi:chemotaxis methyl-accepting protein methylase